MASNPGLRHALQILDHLASAHRGLGFTELKQRLGVQPATASRLLKVLVEERYLEKTNQGTYCVGPRLASIAQRWTGGSAYGPLIEPIVDELAVASGESAAFVEWGAEGITFRAKREMPESYHYMAVGHTNTNPTTNGFGQVALAWHPDALGRFGQTRHRTALRPQLAAIRRKAVHESRDLGLRLCAAVTAPDGALAGVIGISSLRFTMSAADRQRLKQQVRAAADAAIAAIATTP